MKIIVDAMGGDNAPQAPVMGAVQSNREYGVDIILVGRGEAILKVLEENGIQELPAGVEIAHASEVVEMCDNPATAFREKKDSSLTVGLNLLKDGSGDAFVSAGSTGACWSSASGASAGRPWPLWCPRGTAARCSSTAAPTPSVPLSI